MAYVSFLPLRGSTEKILNYQTPQSGMLILSVDEYQMYLYLNQKKGWMALNQNALAYEYICWGFMLPISGKYKPIYLRSYLSNLRSFMPLTLRHGHSERRLKYTGHNYELIFDDDLSQIYVCDGLTPGGKLL